MALESTSQLIGEFGRTIGIENLALDEKGCCCLMFDDVMLNLELTPEPEQFFIYAELGDIPEHGRDEFYAQLLEANFFFRGTGGATLSLDRGANCVLLAYQMASHDLFLQRFSQILENFVNVAATWREKIASAGHGAPSAADAVPVDAPWLRA